MALTATADVMTYVGETDVSQTGYVDMLRAGVEEAFKRLVGRRLESGTATVDLDGNGRENLPLPQTPVQSVASVYVDSTRTFAASSLLTANTDYYLRMDGPTAAWSDSGLLVRRNLSWTGRLVVTRGNLTPLWYPGQGNVRVTYTYGYATIPDDIKQAIYEACKLLRMTRTAVGPKSGEGLGEYSYTTADIMKLSEPFLQVGTLQQVVRNYRRLRLQ